MPRAKAEVKAQVEGAGAQSSRLRVALLCGLVAVTFFFIGRVSVPSVQAAGEPSTPSAVNVAKNPLAPVGDAPAKSIAEALKDPANKFSILAISYKFVDGDDRLAKATQDSLIAQGLPTALCKNVVKKQCFLLVGAAPKLPDLDSLLAKVKQATSERGKQDFTSAYGVPIDNYLAR